MYVPPDLRGIEVGQEEAAQLGDDTPQLVADALRRISHGEDPKLEIFGDADDEFTRALDGIRDRLGIDTEATVLYPGSSTHAGVAHVFGRDKTVHVDPDQAACTSLTEHGYRAVALGIEDYTPDEPFDVMVLLNTYGEITEGNKDHLRQLVKPGGVIIANNYTHWAHDLAALQDVVELQGALLPEYRSAEATYLPASEVPENATDIPMAYYKFGRDGGISAGTPEDHNFADAEPIYPDGLFVFKVK